MGIYEQYLAELIKNNATLEGYVANIINGNLVIDKEMIKIMTISYVPQLLELQKQLYKDINPSDVIAGFDYDSLEIDYQEIKYYRMISWLWHQIPNERIPEESTKKAPWIHQGSCA